MLKHFLRNYSPLLLILFATVLRAEVISSYLKRNRVKRAWDYPPLYIDEQNALSTESFVRKEILMINSDNPSVASYELVPGSIGVDEGYFTIETEVNAGERVGRIYEERPVDREEIERFIIYARALNNQNQQAEAKDVELIIIVRDFNDERPVFIPDTLVGEVKENSDIGSSFLTVRATDDDSSSQSFGTVRYSYVSNSETPPASNGLERFSINSNGQVSLLQEVNREDVQQITFLALAMDGLENGPGFTTTGTVTVIITDANDNAPVFVQSSYTATIGELASISTQVLQVEATDADEGVNQEVYFNIIGGNVGNHFDVISVPNSDGGASVGRIVIKELLDFETRSSYTLTIQAKNTKANENADTLTNTASVTITVTDENEAPVFLGTPYTGEVPENDPNQIDNVVQVQARDYDFGETQNIRYGILNSEGWFDISSDGVIFTVAGNPIDREHINVNQDTNEYTLLVTASDDYSPSKTATVGAIITITDKNDNAPEKGSGWNAIICETPSTEMQRNVTMITADDKDSSLFMPLEFAELSSDHKFTLENSGLPNSRIVQTVETHFTPSQEPFEIPVVVSDTGMNGQPSLTSTLTLTIRVCSCNDDYIPSCSTAYVAGFPIAAIIAIIAAILILLIIILAVVAYRRRSNSELEKQALFYDEDDVRENLQAYHEEGGEEDNDGYDISALQAPPLISPKRQDVTPLGGPQPQSRSRIPPDTDVGDYINDAKDKADADPTAPPYDSILVFDYEGQGSDAGSLSSLNSGTTDASQDYDHLNNWGPRFKKLADMYGGGEED